MKQGYLTKMYVHKDPWMGCGGKRGEGGGLCQEMET